MPLPVLHVGFHKSGSTTLQTALFARHSQIANLGEPEEHPSALEAMRNAWESCNRDPAERRPFDLERNRALWKQALASAEAGKVPVFSKERLTLYEHCSEPGEACLPAKLRELVGPARIVIMTRQQIKLVESLYYSKTDGEMTPERWLQMKTDGALNRDRFHIYRYHAFAEAYATAFGRENVGVFMLEELANSVASFAQRLCQFIGIDAVEALRLLQDQKFHTRKTLRGIGYAKFRKLVSPNIHFGRYVPDGMLQGFSAFLSRGKPVRVQLPAGWVADMRSYYCEDNRRLARDWDLPLERYGYPL